MTEGIEMLVNPFGEDAISSDYHDNKRFVPASQSIQRPTAATDELVQRCIEIFWAWNDHDHFIRERITCMPKLSPDQINNVYLGLIRSGKLQSVQDHRNASLFTSSLIQETYNAAIDAGAHKQFYLNPGDYMIPCIGHLYGDEKKGRVELTVYGTIGNAGYLVSDADITVHGDVQSLSFPIDNSNLTVYGRIGDPVGLEIIRYTNGYEVVRSCTIKTTDEASYSRMCLRDVTKNCHKIHLINEDGEILRSNGK